MPDENPTNLNLNTMTLEQARRFYGAIYDVTMKDGTLTREEQNQIIAEFSKVLFSKVEEFKN